LENFFCFSPQKTTTGNKSTQKKAPAKAEALNALSFLPASHQAPFIPD